LGSEYVKNEDEKVWDQRIAILVGFFQFLSFFAVFFNF
jgi:hypothetical protein